VIVGYGTVWRFFEREDITFKKSVRAAEQERPAVAEARLRWTCDQPRLDPAMGVMTPYPDVSLPQQGQRSFTYVLDGKAIFTHHDVARSRRTEAVYAQHVTAIADVAMPALRCAGFDGKSRAD